MNIWIDIQNSMIMVYTYTNINFFILCWIINNNEYVNRYPKFSDYGINI